ncbi:MAG: ribonuclease R [Crocinitomicaceae bacterium]|nr:ribonuclease R [Crocinitomicaceae bacterium]
MSRRKSPKNKLKKSLTHIVRKVFSENPESTFDHKQVCTLIDARESAIRKLVFSILEDQAKTGFIKKHGHSVYQLNHSENFFEGSIQITQRGAGFVVVDDPFVEDVFIAPHNLHQALNGDRVKIQITKKGRSRNEGTVLEVLERDKSQFVGTIEMHEKFAFLVPDNSRVGTDIYIPKEKLKGAKNGDKALAKITVWPKSKDNPFGEVIEVLGNTGGNDTEMISILVNQGLNYTFPDEVLSESEKVTIDLDPKEIAGRRDFRDTTTFTIDPLDAKDFDDAISFKRLENGNLEVGVHIADVSHYVRVGTAMDAEALKRSNSVYLVDRVVPMLPEQLSNLVCSLRPDEDKFTFSAVFEIDETGKVYNEWFGKTVIHSNRRYTYEEAQEIIEGKLAPKEGEYVDEINLLDKIAKILRKRRLKSGAMNIESEEVRFRLDDEGNPIEVVVKTSKDAHKLIEEFMLLANRMVATFISKPNQKDAVRIPFIYRCHDHPNPEKIGMFNMFIQKFGYDIDVTDPNKISTNINSLLADIRYKNEFSLIQTMAIRSMAKATYETTNIGHYGLSFSFYSHFTSPIRRYADLVVHRILQEELTKKKHRYGSDLDDICKRISRMERKAVDAERESTKYFQTLFVIDKIGEEFDGTISGVADFGIFVKMDENSCEGMIPLSQIPGDRFHFDADKFAVVGAKTKKEYNFGDRVRVRIYEVSTRKRQIDLEIVE